VACHNKEEARIQNCGQDPMCKGRKKDKPEGFNIIIETKNYKFSWDLFIMSVDCGSSF
jgi:hypothetical protein